jgi:mRNA interferase RelE/StbE
MIQDTEYKIQLTSLALEMLAEIKDKRHLQILGNCIEKLKFNPEEKGKPLTGKLKGYHSIRAVGQRYRIVYQVQRLNLVVMILGVGLRVEGDKKDIYQQIKKFV